MSLLKLIDASDKTAIIKMLDSRNMEIDPQVTSTVLEVIQQVRKRKDEALYEYTENFDHVKLSQFEVSASEIEHAFTIVDAKYIEVLQAAASNIRFYHEKQVREGYEIEKDNGVYLGQRVIPLERVGVYVPGGRAAYPSTVLMDVIPARIANVNEIVMCTPPQKDGSVNPHILVAAAIAKVDKIYKVGGAQAIAAMAYGTQTIARVDKIVGPGNLYVSEAKRLVYGQVDIDMIAGPSEILVIADEGANPAYVAADLMSQAEHDPCASSILIATSKVLVEAVEIQLQKQLEIALRKDIVEQSFHQYGYALVVDTIAEAITISNLVAPEHLELMVKEPKQYLKQVQNAGSVFLGYYTCESIGDYFGGTNHVLPTNGTARFYSPLGVDSFIKKSSYLHYSQAAIKQEGDAIIYFATQEGLEGHANAVKVRIQNEAD